MTRVNGLFAKEEQAYERAERYLAALGEDAPPGYREEFAALASEYRQLLRQLKRMIRLSDLTAQGLNADREALLTKINEDALTEIYNRHFLMSTLGDILRHLEDRGEPISILMLDVDYFKNYNDTYGHSAGDECLKKIAAVLCASTREGEDFVVRYGGEEFIVLLPGAGKERGVAMARRILANIWKMNLPHASSAIADRITLSIGLVSAVPRSDIETQRYIDRADAAMYLSKQNGRNRLSFLPIDSDTPEFFE